MSSSGKSDQAFRTISEVSKELDLPQHVLRFWETRFHQIAPLKRGGGRRYYRPRDVDLLRRIKSLLHSEGYTIKGVQRMLGQGTTLPDAGALPAAGAQISPAILPDGPAARPVDDGDMAGILRELEEIRDLLKKTCS